MLEMAKIRRTLELVGTWIIKRLLRAGVPMGPMILLTVRGRTTGQPRTTPVDLLERNDRRWLVAPPTAEPAPTGCAISAQRAKASLPAAVAGRRLPPWSCPQRQPGPCSRKCWDLAWRRPCADWSFDAP